MAHHHCHRDGWLILAVTATIALLGLLTILFETWTFSNINDLPHRSEASRSATTAPQQGGGAGGDLPPSVVQGAGKASPALPNFEASTPASVDAEAPEIVPPVVTPVVEINASAAIVLKIRHRWHWKHYPPVRFVEHERSASEFPYWRHVMDGR